MFILNHNEVSLFDLSKSSEFIMFWKDFYFYKIKDENENIEIDYFSELNIGNNLSAENIKNLLRWKDPKYLSETIKSGEKIVYNPVRNLVIEKGHWKLQNAVVETSMEEGSNDQDQRYHVL